MSNFQIEPIFLPSQYIQADRSFLISQIHVACTCNWILWRDLLKPSTEKLLFVCEIAQKVKLLHWMDECVSISGKNMNVDFNFVLNIFLWKHCISPSLNFMLWKNQWYTACCRNKKNTSKHTKWSCNIWFLLPFFKLMLIFKSNTD